MEWNECGMECGMAGTHNTVVRVARSLLKRAIRFVSLVPPLTHLHGCCVNNFTPVPRKSDRRDTELGDHRRSRTLRLGKC